MKRTALLLLSCLLLLSALMPAEGGVSESPAPAEVERYTAPTVDQPVDASHLMTSSPQLSAALAEIFQTPAPHNKSTPTCTAQVRCPNGLWLGCNGYTGPYACESVRYCVVCDGYIYDCPNAFCPH